MRGHLQWGNEILFVLVIHIRPLFYKSLHLIRLTIASVEIEKKGLGRRLFPGRFRPLLTINSAGRQKKQKKNKDKWENRLHHLSSSPFLLHDLFTLAPILLFANKPVFFQRFKVA